MNNGMIKWLMGGAVASVMSSGGLAAMKPAELMPEDALAILSIPDWKGAESSLKGTANYQLWRSADMQPFWGKFKEQVAERFMGPLEKELGVKWQDLAGLVEGQVTVGVLPSSEGLLARPDWVLALDSGSKSGDLKKLLADLKGKWLGAGKALKSQTIRSLEFSEVKVSAADLEGPLGILGLGEGTEEGGQEISFFLGQSDSLFLLGTSTQGLEKVLTRQAGGLLKPLSENTRFAASEASMFRRSEAFGWINFQVLGGALKQFAEQAFPSDPSNPFGPPSASAIFKIMGFDQVESFSFNFDATEEGELVELFMGVPDAKRNGLVKLLVGETKESAPPPFVPANVASFSRSRLSGQKIFEFIETAVNGINPFLGAMLQANLGTLGKEQDPGFDFRKNFIENLGDDLVTYELLPKSSSPEDVAQTRSISLMSSPNPDQLCQSLKVVGKLIPVPGGITVEEREFLGRKLFQIPMPGLGDGEEPAGGFYFASAKGYVAFTDQLPVLEEFLRDEGNAAGPLRATSGLAAAARNVGSMEGGLFGFENDRDVMRVTLEMLKNHPEALEEAFAMSPLAQIPGGESTLKDWFDMSLLPDYKRIEKFFHYTLYGSSAHADGLRFRMFKPVPPGL